MFFIFKDISCCYAWKLFGLMRYETTLQL